MPRSKYLSGFTFSEALLLAYSIAMGPLWMIAAYYEDWGIQPQWVQETGMWVIVSSILAIPVLGLVWLYGLLCRHQSDWALARVVSYVGLVVLIWQYPYETPADRLWRNHEADLRAVADSPPSDRANLPFLVRHWVADDGTITFDPGWNPRISLLYVPDDSPERKQQSGSGFEYVVIRKLAPKWYAFEERRTM